jgi:hypothetical protein
MSQYALQWTRWQAALRGEANPNTGERGDPPSGYYRTAPWKTDADKRQGTLAIWRDPEGAVWIEKNFQEPKTVSALEAEDALNCQHVAIEYELYESRRTKLASAPWPEIHTLYPERPFGDKPGGIWTEAWARARLAANVETHDEHGNRREGIGGNNPPPDDVPPEAPPTPVEAITRRIKSVDQLVADLLAGYGGKPRTKAEADMVANYAKTFKALETEADAARKAEKEPHFEAGKAVDDKWRRPIEAAAARRTKVLKIADEWIDAERARLQADADAANAAAREAAEKQAKSTGAAAAPIEEVKVEPIKLGTGGRKVQQTAKDVWVASDPVAFVKHMVETNSIPQPLADALNTAANNLGKFGITIPGMKKTEVRKAA